MTVADVARLEGVSERSAQRYCTVGFKGHVLPSIMTGKARSIDPADYKAWRVLCGFDPAALDVRGSSPNTPQEEVTADLRTPQIQVPATSFRPWPLCADPAGPVTNAPHEHSSNWPHPKAVEQHRAELLRQQLSRYRGDEYAEPES